MARAKKEPRKVSAEERLNERWTQQVFFLHKYFPESKSKVLEIQKRHKTGKSAQFAPTEGAIEELVDLYYRLKTENPERMVTVTQSSTTVVSSDGSSLDRGSKSAHVA